MPAFLSTKTIKRLNYYKINHYVYIFSRYDLSSYIAMILVKVLLSSIYIMNANGFLGLRHGYEILLKDLNYSTPKLQVAERFIEQPLDHFNQNEKRNWQMRYFERFDLWKEGGPVYLFIGGESEADTKFLQFGLANELAEETNGALYLSEHRYYGMSMPFPETNAKNLVYLSSRQALADIAQLLKYIKSTKYNSSKIVLVGGSYPGNLAAWMKLLYPDLVDAAIASSAPVLAKVDFWEYIETVSTVFNQYGTPECYSKIATQFSRYDQLFQTSAGIEQLKKEENICSSVNMSEPEARKIFFLLKAQQFTLITQYSDPERIKKCCSNITNIDEYYKEREYLTKHSSKMFDFDVWNEEYNCMDYSFDTFINSMKESREALAWTYQTCTEFGYFMTTNAEKQPFTKNIDVDIYYSICSNLFGPEFNKLRVEEGVKNTNSMYGGLNPKVKQVVFVNGDMDPWHRLGVLRDLSKDAPAKLVHGTSHCKDLAPEKSQDSKEMIETRKYVKQLIKKWIGVSEYPKLSIKT